MVGNMPDTFAVCRSVRVLLRVLGRSDRVQMLLKLCSTLEQPMTLGETDGELGFLTSVYVHICY